VERSSSLELAEYSPERNPTTLRSQRVLLTERHQHAPARVQICEGPLAFIDSNIGPSSILLPFQRPLPLLVDVPGFEGIRIHPGNGIGDTSGCLLVGRDRAPCRVLQSRVAFEALFPLIARAAGEIWIVIENPPPVSEVAA